MAISTKDELEKALHAGCGELWNMDIEEAIYRRHEAVSQSDLKVIEGKTPLHYLKSRLHGGTKQTPAMALGSAMHTAFFEPDLFDLRHIVAPDVDRRTKKGKAEWKEFVENNIGKSVLTVEQNDAIDRMKESIASVSEIAKYTTGGQAERTFFRPSNNPHIPISYKCRTDYWQSDQNRIVDLKTSISANAPFFMRSVINYGYHVQDAFYSDMIDYFEGQGGVEYVLLVVENVQPYDVAVYQLDDEFRKQGRQIYRDGISTLARCFQSDRWPGYPKVKQVLTAPDWSKRQFEREMLEALD